MKRGIKTLIAGAVALSCMCAAAGCSEVGGMLTTEPNTGIVQGVSEGVRSYSGIAYYELERPEDVKINFEADNIQKISFKYRVLDGGEYSFRSDVITINKSVFADETAGDKRVRIFVDNKYVEVTVRVVSKVIYTTDDFNSIRTNLNGVYVLGADIDFGGQEFWPVGKAVEASGKDDNGNLLYDNSTFEGIFDGMGYSVKNVVINGYDKAPGENDYVSWVQVDADDNVDLGNGFYSQEWYGKHYKAVRDPDTFDKSFLAENEILVKQNEFTFVATVEHQGPSLGDPYNNTVKNQSNGIFVSTGGSAQILNTNFLNITVNCYALSGAVVGSNGGLIKNCYVYTTINTAPYNDAYTDRPYSERAGAIVGINGSGDAAGRIENCVAIYSWSGVNPTRGIADWNNGIIKNCYAVLKDDYVYHVGYDPETKSVPENFDYDDYITEENVAAKGLGWYSMPALPGSLSWVDGKLVFYKNGDIINSDVVRKEFLLDPANFPEENGWDRDVWSFTYGGYPSLKLQSR